MISGFFERPRTRSRLAAIVASTTMFCLIPATLGTAPAQDPATPKIATPTPPQDAPANGAVARAKKLAGEVLDLEPAVAQAELIVAARLVEVSDTKIVHGGRVEQVTQQFRFEPVRVLKGIYARDSLMMTGQDLGIYRFADASDQLARGQIVLILLGRQGQNYFNCNGAATLRESIPRLASEQDTLLTSVEVLIAMTRQTDRNARAALLRDGLKTAKGRDAAPLLLAMGRRAFPASRADGVLDAIAPHLTCEIPALRTVASQTLKGVLEASSPDQHALRASSAKVLVAALGACGPEVSVRIAMIDALGACGKDARTETNPAHAWPKDDGSPRTLAETAARLRALGKIGEPSSKDEVVRAYETMPLDASAEMHAAAGNALARMDPAAAAKLVPARLAAKEEAGLGVASELALLGALPRDLAVPGLLAAIATPLDPAERLALAQSCLKIADPRLVAALANMLDPGSYQVRMIAADALVKIDTDDAAKAIWPHLGEEADAARRLRMVAFVGRHGFRDGYADAIEHLSQDALREEAVEALAAIAEPKAIPELRRIWATSNDLAWNASAVRALGRLDQQDIAPKLLEVARTDHPLAASALIALGDLGHVEALPIVAGALASRSDVMVIAATRAGAKLAVKARRDADEVCDKIATLLADPHASLPVRQAAMDALVALDDPRLARALAVVVGDANLEGQALLIAAEAVLSGRGAASANAAR